MSTVEGKTNFLEAPSGCHQPGLLNVWEIINVGCNLKQFDGLT